MTVMTYGISWGDGTATANPEIRFITDGTQTVTKPYTLITKTAESFSFDYRIVNDGAAGVVDAGALDYIVQILAGDRTYPIINPNVVADGEWHTITIDSDTPLYSSTYASKYGQIDDLFCGFLFKMGGLDGEFMIRNIQVEFEGEDEEDLPNESASADNSSENSSSESVSDSTENSEEISEKPATSEDGNDDLVEEPAVPNDMFADILEKIGCSSVMGSSVISLTALFGVSLILKKKED